MLITRYTWVMLVLGFGAIHTYTAVNKVWGIAILMFMLLVDSLKSESDRTEIFRELNNTREGKP